MEDFIMYEKYLEQLEEAGKIRNLDVYKRQHFTVLRHNIFKFHFLLIFDFYKNNADKFSLTTLNRSGFVEPVALYTCSIISPMLISGSAIPLKRIRII